MYTDDGLIPISALNHFLYCERRCALVHIEQVWLENRFTAEGRIMHERVDSGKRESRGDFWFAYSLPLRSLRLGLVGKADAVEFQKEKNRRGRIIGQPFPVEYKRGRPKKENWDKVQLCAQALCLEEMMDLEVSAGALFYGKTRRRVDVVFDYNLRSETENTAHRLHRLIASLQTPPPVYTKRCDKCSFLDRCLPKLEKKRHSVRDYLKGVTRMP